jgi:hypothetical protein
VPDLVVPPSDRLADARHRLEAAENGVEECMPARPGFARERDGGGNDDAGRMGGRRPMEIVDLEDVSEPAHDEGAPSGVHRAALDPG